MKILNCTEPVPTASITFLEAAVALIYCYSPKCSTFQETAPWKQGVRVQLDISVNTVIGIGKIFSPDTWR